MKDKLRQIQKYQNSFSFLQVGKVYDMHLRIDELDGLIDYPNKLIKCLVEKIQIYPCIINFSTYVRMQENGLLKPKP